MVTLLRRKDQHLLQRSRYLLILFYLLCSKVFYRTRFQGAFRYPFIVVKVYKGFLVRIKVSLLEVFVSDIVACIVSKRYHCLV